jgi:hypothetical protein
MTTESQELDTFGIAKYTQVMRIFFQRMEESQEHHVGILTAHLEESTQGKEANLDGSQSVLTVAEKNR